ncbi:E3 ubiquitin-protein ligase RNF213 isoform X2 [Colius striatus]|nr:E3 ubiquitin-protein ligase RNF213 isoform X2 [Colius striatus]
MLTPVPDAGAEPGGEVKAEAAAVSPSTTETKEAEGGSVVENVRALISTSGATPGGSADEPPSSTERQQQEEGASLLEGVTAPSDSSEAAPRRKAGGSSQKKKKKSNKAKKDPSSSGEQDSLPPPRAAPAQTTELPVTPKEIQTSVSEGAKVGADVLAGDSGGARESDKVLSHLGKEAGSLEASAKGCHRSTDVMAPPKQSNGDNVAAPSPSSAASKEKVGGGSTTQSEGMVRSNVEGGVRAPAAGQLRGTRPDPQSSGSSKNLASTGERASVSSGMSPGKKAPTSKPATTPPAEHQSQGTKAPAVVKGSQAGKDKEDTRQKTNSSASKNEDQKEKKKTTPSEKITERANQSKGPEVARKDYASVVAGSSKDKKQQNNQKPETRTRNVNIIKESPVSRSDGVMVYFHAILSKDFKLNPEVHKVFIRAEGISPYADWEDNICEMNCTKHLGEHGFLIQGTATLAKEHIDRCIPYKYWVSCGQGMYEYIYKRPVLGSYVNRCLLIRSSLLNNGEWHQYDDIVCVEPSIIWRMIPRDKTKDVVEGKIIAANVMLENIFSILETWSPGNLRNFLFQLRQFYAVTVEPLVHDGKKTPWTELNFGTLQVNVLLLKYLKKIALPFFAVRGTQASQEDKVIKSKLTLGFTILTVVESFWLQPLQSDLADLCSLLCLDQVSQPAILDEIRHIKEAFAAVPGGLACLKTSLKSLCQRCIDNQVDHWVWILPLLHFFDPPVQCDHKLMEEDVWAGLEGLSFAATRKQQEKETLLQLMKEKKYLMEFDETLVKSWISVVPLESLPEFIEHFSHDLLVTLRGVSYRLENIVPLCNSPKVTRLLETLLCAMDERQARALDAHSWKFCLTCCLQLHQVVCKSAKGLWFMDPVTSATVISKIAELQPPAVPGAAVQEDAVGDVFSEALRHARTWFRNVLNQKLLKEHLDCVTFSFPWELRAWNEFVKISFPDEQFTARWKKTLLADLERRIQEELPVHQILAYCCRHHQFTQLDSSIAWCFCNCATEAVTAACQTQSNLLEKISSYNMGHFSQLVSTIIVKSWPAGTGQSKSDFGGILHHLLTWPDIKQIFSFSGTNTKLLKELTDEAKNVMATADSVFVSVIDDIQKGCVLVKHLEEVFQHEQQFICIWQIKHQQLLHEEKEPLQRELKELLQRRLEEVTLLRREQKAIGTFLSMCRRVQASVRVDVGEVESQHLEDLGSKRLKTVVSVGKRPIQTYYSMSPNLKEFALKMHCLKDSLIFQQFWEEAAQEAGECCGSSEEQEGDNVVPALDLDNVFSSLISPCFVSYGTLYDDLRSGSLKLSAVDRIFKEFTNHPEDIKTELNVMCELRPGQDRDWVEQRFQQIQQYHELHLAFEAAKIIASVKESLNLAGDFSILENLLDITEKLESYKTQKLDSISPELMHAKRKLQGITVKRRECLRELAQQKEFVSWVREALKDMNELKVFVDLASISAGENDMDVGRVACFHDAVHGYSSLLYELRQDSGFEHFLCCLSKLWRALDSDKSLPEKLHASALHLEWLKTVKESHGSVELSSLSLAAAINSRGIYVLKAPADGQKISLDNVLHFTLLGSSEGDEASRKYSLAELRELQNKLMLMSAKGEQALEVEKFSEVFSNIQRLAQAFIDLYSAGNMLFRSWLAHVYCSPKREPCVLIDFSLGLIPVLEGQGEMAAVLPDLCKTMEGFLESWKSFMCAKRFEHFYLNYYTAEQLVYLCRELGQGRPSQAALMMLSFLKHNCTEEDVLRASESKAPSSSRRAVADLQVLLAGEQTLSAQLQRIWGCYMSDMGSFLPGCLDMDTLGSWLERLARWDGRRVTRAFPRDLLCVGQPNLITCPRSELLTAALAIYMNSPNQPLPTFDEVLLCTPQTTAEQVGLFLRRCLIPCSTGQRVYSMLYAEELSYDVSCRAEELFQRLQHCHSTYRLVILCSCEREHSYIPSAFSQYKVHMIPQRPLAEIQQYLQHHYRVAQPSRSAASVFKDNMCVGIVASQRAGVGKSLYVKRLHERLQEEQPGCTELLQTIRLIEPEVDEDEVLKSLLPFLKRDHQTKPMIFHFDITSSVRRGIPEFLFKLLVLQHLTDNNGNMWLRQQCHLYIIEILEVLPVPNRAARQMSASQRYNFLDVFPKVMCKSPKEVLEMETLGKQCGDASDPGMDMEEFCSEAFQRPFQYLKRFDQGHNLDTFCYEELSVEGSPAECLQQFLLHCGITDPSWSELRNFTWFLNVQLRDCEASVFCNPAFVQDTLQGFRGFVVGFMILMARDFATPSLNISDQSSGRQPCSLEDVAEEDLLPFRVRKRWEAEPHPYLFFNSDRVSMTFIGFHFQPGAGGVDAVSPLNGAVIKRSVMTSQLYRGLMLQRVPFNVAFDQLPRHEKLERLCMVLGIPWVIDPDETYELTMDNVLKILAIEMRFRCNIPVVIMGETGCGKTRLIKFLCRLRRSHVEVENMRLVKVHGGTTAEMIYARVQEAEALAKTIKKEHGLDTVLFFDEANTTEAISSIKEVLCDRTVRGKPLDPCSGLQIIAACNPYRKHTPGMIQRLELAGLGYRVAADETKEKLGSIPLRQLVYRVHALPPSMIPLVWDFGQLNNFTEKMYIQQIVQRVAEHVSLRQPEAQVITEVLFASQQYMRQRGDECCFVSLRDVERCMEVFKWFHKHSKLLLRELHKFLAEKRAPESTEERNSVIWSLVLAVGVCYHASLEKKEVYRSVISQVLPEPYNTQKKILEEISLMQDLFLSGVHLRDTIARNLALKENVFMMVICIELKIPLFLVGKPGSSKSLAKTIVANAMQGQAAHSNLFKRLKQIHLVSFQCSPLSTPEGIIGTFKQCARFQKGKNLKEYVSVVVLDEIGLAEDSPKMPLKTLHPLLEDGCIDDVPLPHKKVGFIGISNWALDPAKMNRGIFVSRGDPSREELIESARGICCSSRGALQKVERYFCHFADAYENICQAQDREFFGLRDYYSLIKMFFASAKSSRSEPTPQDIAAVVLRNFGGKDDVDALGIFTSQLPERGEIRAHDISRIDLVRQNIYSSGEDGDCRYLLVLTENYAALQILQQAFFTARHQPEIIFGSSFPKDQEYTQICRNINRVKVCMETGQMVVLLNLQNLYESLYDALNQYYVYLADQKYVDLGLGTHRVKCRVHPKFRLIVIEEKEVVHKHFPIPLINRLEKHYLDIGTVLDKGQRETVEELKRWVHEFTAANAEEPFVSKQRYSPSDVFVGYHANTCASVVLQTTERLKPLCAPHELVPRVKREAQLALLSCATPDSVIRLCNSMVFFMANSLANTYFRQQQHTAFADFLRAHVHAGPSCQTIFTEVTTFSRLLTSADAACLEREVQGKAQRPRILFLQQFDTEYSFLKSIRDFLDATSGNKVLIIQTDFEDGSQSAQLIASAKYTVVNEINKVDLGEASVFVYFIMKLSRVERETSYVGFHGGLWQSVHIDDLRRSRDMISDMTVLQNLSISQMFCEDSGDTKAAALPVTGEQEENEMEVGTPVHREGEILNTTVLLRTCVQSAVGMLWDQNQDLSRSRKRIEILLGLLSREDGLKASFLKVTKDRLASLLKKQEERSFHPKNWVLREASNLSALQEAGTFRHALWKRVQKVITPFLALLIAAIDRNGNLELLARPPAEWVTKLWMFIFSDTKLLTVPYGVGKSSSQPEIILVQNNMMVPADAGNKVPFSWRIKEYLDEMWLKAQYIQNTEDQAEKFVDIFQKTALGKFISALNEEDRQMLFQSYAVDFIVLTVGASSPEELKCLQVAFFSCIEEWKATAAREETLPSLPWVHLSYDRFKSRLQNLSRILAVHPAVVGHLHQGGYEMPPSEMVLDVLAAIVCAEELESQVQTMHPEVWLQKVKNLRMPIEFICKEKDSQRSGIQCHQLLKALRVYWNRVFSMSLFVEHVLFGIDTLMPELESLVKKYTLLLAECFQDDSDMKTHPTFVSVMKVLCQCKEEVSNRLCRYGLKSCPICLHEPKDPVCLPCCHVFCQKCIRMWLVPAQMHCPYCRVAVENDDCNVSVELRDAIARNALFRQRCNNFFIDVVTTMCFKDNEPPEAEVIQELLNLLFVHRSLSRNGSGHPAIYTKFLSPFNDEVDETPIIRSVMLKLLLKYSFNEVKNDVQHYLSRVEHNKILEKNDKKELYLLFVNCLEDSMCEKSEDGLGYEHVNYLPRDRVFPENYLPKNDQETPQESSVEYLQAVAKVRLCLSKAAELLFDLHQPREQEQAEEKQHYLANVRDFCSLSKNDWHRVYLVRRVASQHGMEFAQKLVAEADFNWVFPVEILQQLQNSQSKHIDRYLVCGEDYRALRDAVGKAMIQCETEDLLKAEKASSSSSAVQSVHLLLAVFREVTALYGASDSSLHPKQQQTDAMAEFIQNSQVLNSPDLQHFATCLVTNTLPSLTVDPQSFSHSGALIEMAVHAAAVLLCGQNPILQPLRNLAFHPHTMEHSFLPTMPEDMVAQARAWEGMATLRWYTCPNGHPCTVGECGRPMETSQCVDCGAQIGGKQHKPLHGFQEFRSHEDRTQTGHILGDAQNRNTMGVCDRALSPLVFILIRLLTHLTMLLGATKDPQSLQKIIKPPVPNPVSFLQRHIQKDLAHLTKILGKSVDDTVNILHLVLISLLEDAQQQPGQCPVQFDDVLSTKENRNKWEEVVAKTVIVPELEDLDKKILLLNRQIQEDERIFSNPLVKMVYGDPAMFLPHLPKDSHIHHSKMWSCRKRISVENLGHVVQQKNAMDTVPLLWKFLQKEAELRLVKFLPEILALQRDLVKRFQNTTDGKHCSIREFLSEPLSDVMRDLLQRRVDVFLSVWNKLRSSLDTNGEIKLPKGYCDADLTLDSKLEILLPRRQGLGLCSTALASYLISLHNDFIHSVNKHIKEDDRYMISLSEVADLHLISYEVERDLIPLILSNCQYSMEKGGETLQDFDLERIQQQVISKFLQGKPLITLKGIPTLVYREDRNYEQLFNDVRDKVDQSALPSSVMNMISGELQSYSDVCDALSVTEITLGFLAMAGENAEMLLTDYIENILQMGDQTNPLVLQALRRCHLKHNIALWQLLSTHKSEQLLRLRRDPFVDVSAVYKAELSPEIAKLLNTYLVHSRLETFLQELHEMIVLKLGRVKAVDELRPTWSLKEVLIPYLDEKQSEIATELQELFPEEILLSHATETWKATAQFKRERRDR